MNERQLEALRSAIQAESRQAAREEATGWDFQMKKISNEAWAEFTAQMRYDQPLSDYVRP